LIVSIFKGSQTDISRETDMKMLSASQISDQEITPYATGADFCRIFLKHMDGLYLLSFLLTGEYSIAEKCFVRGWEDSQKGNPVFKEWTQSWARRTIIRSAIEMMRPQPIRDRNSSLTDHSASCAMTQAAEIAMIVGLPPFERFVFVMSVLERYSDLECSLLLDCTRGDLISARTWVLQQMARATQIRRKVISIDSDEQSLPDNLGSHRGIGSGFPGKVSRAETRRT
jgi:DNA-directed RNA polymerase specialized sigma24 family protein